MSKNAAPVFTFILALSFLAAQEAPPEKNKEELVKKLTEMGITVKNQPVMLAEVFTVAPEDSKMVVRLGNPTRTMVLGIGEKATVKQGKKTIKLKDLKRGDKVILLLDAKTTMVAEIYLDKK
ncbi:MAG TPA: hypothetical protein VGK99_17210 [Acidobacteriota bacterium]|jgi:hypothetical protein